MTSPKPSKNIRQKPSKADYTNGTYRQVPLTGLEPPSDHMTAEAKQVYEELVQDLAMRGDCSRVDRYVIEALADSVANYRKSRDMLSKSSELIKNKQGNFVQNPLRFSLQGERSALMGIAVQLRVTPKSRWVEPDKEDEPQASPNVSGDF